MKLVVQLLAGIFFILMVNHAQAQTCADTNHIYKFKYHGKKYEIVKELKSWDSAAACAVQRGGYLAQINNQMEQDSIYHAIVTGAGVSSTYTVVGDGGGIAYIWIGGTDKHAEGTWLWDGNNDNIGTNFWTGQGAAGAGGGSAVGGAYNHWGGTTSGTANEPDNYAGNQNAAAIGLASWPYGIAGEWNDINATNVLYYVIEYDSTTTGVKELKHSSSHGPVFAPNPAHHNISILNNNPDESIATVTLYNQLGTIAIQSKSTELDVAHLPSGFYIATIDMEGGERFFKTVVIE